MVFRSYSMYRDKLQRMRWNFNRKYVTLPTVTTNQATTPPFEYAFAYNLPDDYLRLELATLSSQSQFPVPPPPAPPPYTPPPPSVVPAGPTNVGTGMPGVNLADFNNSRSQDYRIVGKQIWSNQFPPLYVIYGARITDPNQFDASFVEAFACYLAWQWCERTTTSGQKKTALAQEYNMSIREALMTKAIELPPETIPDDTFLLSREMN